MPLLFDVLPPQMSSRIERPWHGILPSIHRRTVYPLLVISQHLSLTLASLSPELGITAPNQNSIGGTAYTSTPSRVLITAAETTAAKSAADLKMASTFIAVSASPKARQKELLAKTFAGAYIYCRTNQIKPIYVLTTGNITTADGTIVKQFVAQGVNDSSRIQPEAASLDIASNVVILIESPPTPIPEGWRSNVGQPFKKADVITSAPALHALIPTDDKTYHLVILCKALPIRFGPTEVHRGTIDDVCSDLLEQNLPGSCHWAIWMAQWSKPIHEAVVAVYKSDDKALGVFLPKVNKKFVSFFAKSAITRTETLYQDDAEHAPALSTLKTRLFQVVPQVEVPPASVVTSPDLEEAANSSESAKTVKSVSTAIPRKPTIAKFTPEESNKMKYRLSHSGFDPVTNTLVIPELVDDMQHLFSLTNMRDKNSSFDDTINSYAASVDDDSDFLRRMLDFPEFNQATLALYLNSYLPTKNITDLDGAKTKFRCYMAAPDNEASIRARDDTKDDRLIQGMLGETGTNLSKVNTDIVFNHMILSYHPFLGFLANRCGLIEASIEVDSENWDDPSNPCLFRFIKALAFTLTSSKCRSYFKCCSGHQKSKFFGWLLQMFDAYECYLNQIPTLSRNTQYALSGEYSKIKIDPLSQAEDLKDEIISKMLKITSNTDSVPEASLNNSIEAKAEKKRPADKDASKVTPDTKRVKKGPEGGDVTIDKSGPLIYKQGSHMPTATEPDPTKRLCTPHIRKGLHCRKNPRCQLVHEKDPMKWPVETLDKWMAHVEATPNLEWDSSVDIPLLKTKVDAYAKPPASAK